MLETIEQNKALMRRIYEEMWNQGNAAAAGEIFAQPEGVREFVTVFLAAFPDLRHTVEEMIAEGNQVAARFSTQGTHLGPWKGYAPTGRPIHYTGVTVARVQDGKITEHRTWWDTLELIEQIRGERD